MDYVESVTFVTRDEKWIEKIALGALATIIPIIGWLALAGWGMEAFRRAATDDPEKLPGWGNVSAYLGDGLKWLGVMVIWGIPVAILGAIWRPLGALASIPVAFLSLGALIIIARTGDWMRALNPMNDWALLGPSVNQWIVIAIIIWAASLVASFIGGIALGVGLLITTPWLMVASGNLVGKAYLETHTQV